MLLDTTFLIDAERSQVELDEAINDDDDVAIAAVTVAELLMGVTLADAKHQTDRATFVDGVLDAVPVLPYDLRVARGRMQSCLPTCVATGARGVPTI
ncbi:hypothetical protein BH24ACT15_BH24ACT15_23090 [soil metagenome]